MLTNAEVLTLRTALFAETDPTFVGYRTNTQTQSIADWYNTVRSPAFVVWRRAVTQDEIMQNGFDWVQVDNLSVGKARIWEWLFGNEERVINPSKPNVRAGIDEAWKGTAAMLAVRDVVYSHCRRNATRGEVVFATGTGSTADPALLGFEGLITAHDIGRVMFNDDGTLAG